MKTIWRYSVVVELRVRSGRANRRGPEHPRVRQSERVGAWLLLVAVPALAALGAHVTVVL
jgi:hypothetical protein